MPSWLRSFVNQGREYRAVRYIDPNGVARYYTPEGLSMHRAFLRTPLEFTPHQLALQSESPASGAEPHPRS